MRGFLFFSVGLCGLASKGCSISNDKSLYDYCHSVYLFLWYIHVFCVAKDGRRLQNDLSYVQEAITWRLIDRIAPWFFIL